MMPLTASPGESTALVTSLADLELCVCINLARVRRGYQMLSQWINQKRNWLCVIYNLDNVSAVDGSIVWRCMAYGCMWDISRAISWVSFAVRSQIVLLDSFVRGIVNIF